MRRSAPYCALGLAGAVLLSGTAPAAPAAPWQTRHPLRVKATAGQLFELAAQLQRRGNVKRALAILEALENDPIPEIRREARYRQALVLEANGRNGEAAVLLRQVLDEQPDAGAVRLKLATMLRKMGDEAGALRQLRALRTIDLPPTVARFVDRLAASLQASKPFGFQVEVALAPDSNINRATRSDTLGTVLGDFTLDPESKAKSGIGVTIRGMGQARKSVTAGLSVVARSSVEARLYRDKDFNDITLDLSAGPEWQLDKLRLTAEAGVSKQWYGMESAQRALRVAGSVTRPIGAVSQARLDAGYRWVDNRLNDLQDGHDASARLHFERALSPTTLVSASIGADRFKARDDAYSTTFYSGGVTGYREIGRMTLSAGIEVARLKADERLQLLPEVRKDRLLRLQVGSVFRQLTVGGFAPMVRLVIERNKSSVEYYDYTRRRTEIGVVRAF
jgi:tetratricopeptide (TPR) repeat protein